MHRCLSIIEVQRAVFQEVHLHNDGPSTLAGLASTCRVFNNVALDILWTTLSSFAFLIRCLPQDLWKIDCGGGLTKKTLAFRRAMSLSDWEIFFSYSSRVRFLCRSGDPVHLTQCWDLHDDVIFALSNPPTYGPLLPHLKELRWDKPIRKYASLLRLLLAPTLSSLSLSSYSLRSPAVSILSSIGTVCPSLRHLSITHDHAVVPIANSLDSEGQKILSKALLRLHRLESLVCHALDEAAIAHICRLPSLASLSLELRHGHQLKKLPPLMMPPTFASLRTLKLYAFTLPTLTSLLQVTHFKPESLSFDVRNIPTPDELDLFFRTVAAACGSENLCNVSLCVKRDIDETAHHEISLSTFEPLLIPSIRSFEFDVLCYLMFDDDDITTLTKRWPNLTTLSLNTKASRGHLSQITHEGLLTLLSRCTALTTLVIPIDFSAIDVPPAEISDARRGSDVTESACTSINVVMSEIQYPATIAAFLSDAFPRLKKVKSSWGEDMSWEDVNRDEAFIFEQRWNQIDELLPTSAAVWKICKARVERT